jgi:hypothetical protein
MAHSLRILNCWAWPSLPALPGRCDLAKIGELKGLDVFDPIDDPATELDEGRALALAAPAFGGPM